MSSALFYISNMHSIIKTFLYLLFIESYIQTFMSSLYVKSLTKSQVNQLHKEGKRLLFTLNALQYRNAQQKDLENIGTLCAECFEGPFEWFQIFEKRKAYEKSIAAINQRYYNFILKRQSEETYSKHVMLVAVDTSQTTNDIVGFVELGQLPSPVKETKRDNPSVDIPSEELIVTAESEHQSGVAYNWSDELNDINDASNDVTYLGNVAVASEYRRQSIATKLIKLSYKILEKWGDKYLYAAVDSNNNAALALYIKKLGFEVVLDERDLISRQRNSQPRSYLRKRIDTDSSRALSSETAVDDKQ